MCDPVTAIVAVAGTGLLSMISAAQQPDMPSFMPLPPPPAPPAPPPPPVQPTAPVSVASVGPSSNSHFNDIKPGNLSLGSKSLFESRLDLRAKQQSAAKKRKSVESLYGLSGLNIPGGSGGGDI